MGWLLLGMFFNPWMPLLWAGRADPAESDITQKRKNLTLGSDAFGRAWPHFALLTAGMGPRGMACPRFLSGGKKRMYNTVKKARSMSWERAKEVRTS